MKMTLDPGLATEAEALVALVFRNGPIEALHAGRPCPQCSCNAEVSHISDEEMKHLMKSAVGALYRLLWLREHDPRSYDEQAGAWSPLHLAWGRSRTEEAYQKGIRPQVRSIPKERFPCSKNLPPTCDSVLSC